MRLIFRILANAAAIIIADRLVPGFIFSGTLADLLITALVLAAVNALVKPLLQLIALPIVLLTLGLFNIIINIAMLLLVAKFVPYLEIQTWWAAFWGVVIVSLMNHLVSHYNRHGDLNNF